MRKPKIGIVGCFQNGKSTLVNCLLDDRVAATGTGVATTRNETTFSWGPLKQVTAIDKNHDTQVLSFPDYLKNPRNEQWACFRVSLWKPLLADIDLVDTPGFDAHEGDDETALNSLAELDFVLLVLRNKGLNQTEQKILEAIAERQCPFSVVVNCMDPGGSLCRPDAHGNAEILKEIQARIRNIGHVPHPIQGQFCWPVNLAWAAYAQGHTPAQEAPQVHREAEIYFDIQASDHYRMADQIYQASKLQTLRQHIQIVAAHFATPLSPEGAKASALIESAQQAVNDGDLNKAMIFAERACYLTPRWIPALLSRANVCLAREEAEETLCAANRVLAIDARHLEAYFLRAKAHYMRQHYPEAGADFLKTIHLIRTDWQLHPNQQAYYTKYLLAACLLKLLCDGLEGKTYKGEETLWTLLEQEAPLLEQVTESSLAVSFWSFVSGLAYSRHDFKTAVDAATKALARLSSNESTSPLLKDLARLYGLDSRECTIGTHHSLVVEIQTILFLGCAQLYGDKSRAMTAFVLINKHDLKLATWTKAPYLLPYYLSAMGTLYGQISGLDSLVEAYFRNTGDLDLKTFVDIAQQNLVGDLLGAFQKTVELHCHITFSDLLNKLTLNYLGNPPLSNVVLEVSYRLDGAFMNRSLFITGTLSKQGSCTWESVCEGKGFLFFGRQLTEFRIVSAYATQGYLSLRY